MKEVMNNILQKAGMSNSTSRPSEVCEYCSKEIEYIQIDHPFDGSKKWVRCACSCVVEKNKNFWADQKKADRRKKINRILKLSSSMEDIKKMTFDNYKVRKGCETAVEEVKDAIKNFEKRGKLGVFLFGETGNGKSHLTAAGGNELINNGFAVIFITEKDLFSRLQATKNFRNEESFHEIMSACLEADLLIWDDFMSSQKLTDDEKDWTFQIVNGRERANKPIWATSNMTPKEFESDSIAFKLDDKGRTWGRLLGNMNFVFVKASNYRKLQAISRMTGKNIEELET